MFQSCIQFAAIESFVQQINALPYCDEETLDLAICDILERCGFRDGTSIWEHRFDKDTPASDRGPNAIFPNPNQAKNAKKKFKNDFWAGNFDPIRTIPEFRTGLWYVRQPISEVDYPDKFLILYGRLIPLEEKTTKTKAAIKMGNTLPHPRSLYVVSDGGHNTTRIFQMSSMGKTLPGYKWRIRKKQELKALIEQWVRDTENDPEKPDDGYCEQLYGRLTWAQMGGEKHYDYVQRCNESGWHEVVADAIQYQLKKGYEWNLNHK